MSIGKNKLESSFPIGKADLIDLVFDGKNKEYGAFVLRKLYSKFLTFAVSIACLIFVLSISSPIIVDYIKKLNKKNIEVSEDATVGKAEFSKYREEKKEEKKPDQEKEKQEQAKKTVKFEVPEMKATVTDAEKYEAPKPTAAQLGTVTQEGDANFDPSTAGIDAGNIDLSGEPAEVKPEIFKYVEEMPSFPNGQDELIKFIGQNVKYPEIARRAGVEGKVFVQFVVGTDGRVGQVSIAKGIGAGCDEEAMRVVKLMPKWTPGKQNGRAVLVQVIVPIIFKLQ